MYNLEFLVNRPPNERRKTRLFISFIWHLTSHGISVLIVDLSGEQKTHTHTFPSFVVRRWSSLRRCHFLGRSRDPREIFIIIIYLFILFILHTNIVGIAIKQIYMYMYMDSYPRYKKSNRFQPKLAMRMWTNGEKVDGGDQAHLDEKFNSHKIPNKAIWLSTTGICFATLQREKWTFEPPGPDSRRLSH